MINQKMVTAFLNRPLENHDWIKTQPDRKVDQYLAELDPVPDFRGLKPWLHQRACFILLNELDRFIFHINMGGGKTLLTLLFYRYKKQCGLKPRALIFVPYLTAVETWVEEVAKHTPDLKCVPLLGSTKENLYRLGGDGDLFVICYQSAVAMFHKKVTRVSIAGGRQKQVTEWELDQDKLTVLRNFNFMVCDEIHKTKSRNSLAYAMCKYLSARCQWAIGLTGTPFGRDLQDLWPQFYLIDFGETLGKTLTMYRQAFFTQKVNYWGGFKWKFQKKMLPQLTRMIKNRSIHYSIDEFYEMPPKKYIIKKLSRPDVSLSYITEAMNNLKSALKGGKPGAYQLVESNYLQLRQLSSGFMTLKGEDSERLQIKFDDNPKLEVLADLIEQMPPGCKMIVFHHFVYTNTLISDMLKKMKVKHARIWGKQRDPVGELRRFKDDDECQVLVINSRSGSSSLNLQLANYVVFFEQPDSPIDRQQGEARAWRPGQSRRVFFYDLLMTGTMDERIYHANKAGENLLQALLKGKEQL